MNVIRYSAGKLLGLALVTGGIAAFWLWVLVEPKLFMGVHGGYGFLLRQIAENGWLSGALFALFGGLTLPVAVMATGDRTALAMGPEGVEVRTMFSRHRAGWDRVAGIGIDKTNRLAGRGETLIVRLRQELGEKALRLSTGLLEQSRWEINRLLESVGRPGVGGEAAAEPGNEAAPAMDYDAVIARHLAARQGDGSVPARGFARPTDLPRPPRGGFGRKGL